MFRSSKTDHAFQGELKTERGPGGGDLHLARFLRIAVLLFLGSGGDFQAFDAIFGF
jgi:hypothetical protein